MKHKQHCLRCGNNWLSDYVRPKQCPSCKSTYWYRKYTRSDKIGQEVR